MKEPVRVLDPQKLALRMFYLDVAACGLVLVGVYFLASDLYFLGRAAEFGGDLLARYPGVMLRVPLAGGLFAIAFGWVTYRVLGQAYRNVTRVV